MKILIFAIPLVVYMQATLAIGDPSPNCLSDLTQLKINARNLVTHSKKLLDSGHETLAKVAELGASLFKMEYLYLGGYCTVNRRRTSSNNSTSQLKVCYVRIKRMKLKLIIAKVPKDILTTIGKFQLNKNISVGNARVLSAKHRYKCVQLKASLFPAVKVKRADAKGLGLFASEKIKSYTIIGEYVGEIITLAELSSRGDRSYALQYGPYYIDSRLRGNYTRFVNTSHRPNAAFDMVDIDGEKHSVLIAKNDIEKEHEITADYGPLYSGACFCNEENCTGKIGIYKCEITKTIFKN